jgi:hypothetical protein
MVLGFVGLCMLQELTTVAVLAAFGIGTLASATT